jgi:hypothetical protein
MRGTALLTTFVVALALSTPAAQAPAAVTPAQAAPFIGDWTLTLQGPNGPGAFGLAVKVANDKVVGEISNEMMPQQTITDVSLADKSLLLSYSFTWEGNQVGAVVSMTPGEGDKMAARIDFAGGAYVMDGTAAKKEKK